MQATGELESVYSEGPFTFERTGLGVTVIQRSGGYAVEIGVPLSTWMHAWPKLVTMAEIDESLADADNRGG